MSGGENLSSQGEDERDTLDAYRWDPDEFRLACQCLVERDGEIVFNLPDPE
jgi:ferredoxin